MTFNSSCAFAGMANMLGTLGIETEDREIALGMKLPYCFEMMKSGYAAGVMLQSAAWFNLYLKPRGLEMLETEVPARELPAFLRKQNTAMLGVRFGPNDKHAVVYEEEKNGKLHFLNNKWEQEPSPERFTLMSGELEKCVDAPCCVATLRAAVPEAVDFDAVLARSAHALRHLYQEIREIGVQRVPSGEIKARMNTHFRPLLLDAVTMLGLLDETGLESKLCEVRSGFLDALRSGEESLCLAEWYEIETLDEAADEYMALITAARAGIQAPDQLW